MSIYRIPRRFTAAVNFNRTRKRRRLAELVKQRPKPGFGKTAFGTTPFGG